jgi:hypothetical protein
MEFRVVTIHKYQQGDTQQECLTHARINEVYFVSIKIVIVYYTR